MFSDYTDRIRADMEIALERACRDLPERLDNHDCRREIAEKLMQSVGRGDKGLAALTAVAQRAVSELCKTRGLTAKSPFRRQSLPPG